ncbi:hypothetical protein MRBLMS1_000392 [Massilia sp. LMS1-1-1.1]
MLGEYELPHSDTCRGITAWTFWVIDLDALKKRSHLKDSWLNFCAVKLETRQDLISLKHFDRREPQPLPRAKSWTSFAIKVSEGWHR